ncbi:hypothetical protein ACFE04_019562 [Oxalis oulophora]
MLRKLFLLKKNSKTLPDTSLTDDGTLPRKTYSEITFPLLKAGNKIITVIVEKSEIETKKGPAPVPFLRLRKFQSCMSSSKARETLCKEGLALKSYHRIYLGETRTKTNDKNTTAVPAVEKQVFLEASILSCTGSLEQRSYTVSTQFYFLQSTDTGRPDDVPATSPTRRAKASISALCQPPLAP